MSYYAPPWRFETGAIYKYSAEHNAYIFYATKIQLSKTEYAQIKKENSHYEKQYDQEVKT